MYRDDSLRDFISVLRKPLCDTLFSCKPPDLLTALALAQELVTTQTQNNFPIIYNHGLNRASQHPPVLISPRHQQNTYYPKFV